MDVKGLNINAVLFLVLMSHSILDGCGTSVVTEQQKMAARPIAELSVSALVEAGKEFDPKSFDISPDGRVLAVLHSSWEIAPNRSPGELWLTIWDVPSRKTLQSIRVVPPGEYHSDPRDVKRVIFTSGQARILVLAQGKLSVVDPENAAISLVNASSPALEAPVRIQALSGSVVAVTYTERDEDGYFTQLLDVSSFKTTPGWHSSTFPQSFSPDGKLAVATAQGEWNEGGVAGLQLIDATNGAKLRSIAVDFGFRWPLFGEKAHGGVVARFLDNHRILVCPDHMIDSTGNHSGYDLEIIDVVENRVVGKIRPPSFVPVGQLVLSQDRSHFAVYSISASPWAYHTESMNPKDFKRQVFVFARDLPGPEAVIEDIRAGFGTYAGDSMRFSADGSVIAIADGQNKSVRTFKIQKGLEHKSGQPQLH